MTLKEVITKLMELNFLNVHSKVQIAVSKGWSRNINDILFESYMPIDEAKHYLEVIINQVRILDNVLGFWFLLAYEKEEE